MIASSRNFAIGMVHFQIAGGLRMLVASLALYVVLLGTGMGLFYYHNVSSPRMPIPLSVVLALLLGLQGVVLVIFGGMRVSTAIRTDLSSKMIESHRLMPIPAWRALMGYLFGSPTHALAFAVVNGLATLAIAVLGTGGPAFSKLVLNHAVLLAFAVFVWSFAALGTFLYRNALLVAIGAVVFGTCTQLIFAMILIFPGLSLLLTPFIGDTVFSFSSSGDVSLALGVALIGQAGLFGVFFAAACRRYRGSYATTFSVLLALILLALWAGLSGVGAHGVEGMPMRNMFFGRMGGGGGGRHRPELPPAMHIGQVIAGMLSCGIVALLVLWPLVRRTERGTREWVLRGLVLALATALVILPGFGAQEEFWSPWAMTISVLVMGAQVVLAFLVMYVLRNLKPLLMAVSGGVLLGALWAGPMILEGLWILVAKQEPDGIGRLSMLSPIGSLINAWVPEFRQGPWLGLAWQWGLVGVVAGLAWMLGRRKPSPAVVVSPA